MGKKRNKSKNKILEIISLLIVLVIVLTGKNINEKDHTQANTEITENSSTLTYSLEDIPEYSGTPYAILNNNKPEFTEKDYTTKNKILSHWQFSNPALTQRGEDDILE